MRPVKTTINADLNVSIRPDCSCNRTIRPIKITCVFVVTQQHAQAILREHGQ